jgi:hypothetical protein
MHRQRRARYANVDVLSSRVGGFRLSACATQRRHVVQLIGRYVHISVRSDLHHRRGHDVRRGRMDLGSVELRGEQLRGVAQALY